MDLIKDMSVKGLTKDEGRGIISLMDKPSKNLLYITNWRPLSLLNSDGKVFSKVLANRTYRVLPQLIHNDQSGFQKNKEINDNLLDLISIIEYSDLKNMENILVAVDFYKAFDTVSWSFFYKVLAVFGFGDGYINMVQKLLEGNESCTINNGWASKYFNIRRGFRQGDCYSPPGFLLVIEILGMKIRENSKIEGITIGQYYKKQAQFADDLWAVIKAKQKVLDAF